MAGKPEPKQDDAEQSKRFMEAARASEADETEEGARRAFQRVVARPNKQKKSSKFVMIDNDSIKKFFQIEVDHPSVALRDILLRLRHGVMRRSTRSEPIAILGECATIGATA